MTTSAQTRRPATAAGDSTDQYSSVDLGPGVAAGFTGGVPGASPPPVGVAGNLSHRRPHVPARLAAERAWLGERLGVRVEDLHFMRQVHGRHVAVIDGSTPRGAEVRGVDALVTTEPLRALCVQAADCVPVLLASSSGPVAAAHAGRRGVHLGIVQATLEALARLGAEPATLTAAIGPAIAGCCYEVPEEMRRDLATTHPAAAATTRWGTPALDLPAAVETILRRSGVAAVAPSPGCTRCDPDGRWFSHRSDPDTGRQVGVVVRLGTL